MKGPIRIDFILGYDQTNVEFVRYQLMDAIVETELAPHWYEWDPLNKDCPAEYRVWSKPTILINGKPIQLRLESLSMPEAALNVQTLCQMIKAESPFVADLDLAS